MSVSENQIFLQETEDFTPGIGEFIALEVATGAGLAELHEAYPEKVPNPIVVNRWRSRYPGFDVLMGEAEVAAAQKFAWDVVKIADDKNVQAAQANNRIKARQWLAGKLHERYGAGKPEVSVTLTQPAVQLTRDQLLEIAGSAYKKDVGVIPGRAGLIEVDEGKSGVDKHEGGFDGAEDGGGSPAAVSDDVVVEEGDTVEVSVVDDAAVVSPEVVEKVRSRSEEDVDGEVSEKPEKDAGAWDFLVDGT